MLALVGGGLAIILLSRQSSIEKSERAMFSEIQLPQDVQVETIGSDPNGLGITFNLKRHGSPILPNDYGVPEACVADNTAATPRVMPTYTCPDPEVPGRYCYLYFGQYEVEIASASVIVDCRFTVRQTGTTIGTRI